MSWSARSVYFHLVSLAMLLTLVFGTVGVINAVIDLFEPGTSSGPRSVPKPLDGSYEEQVRADLRRLHPELTEEEIHDMAAALIAERDQLTQQQGWYWRIRNLIQRAAVVLIAFPVYRYHWRRAEALVHER